MIPYPKPPPLRMNTRKMLEYVDISGRGFRNGTFATKGSFAKLSFEGDAEDNLLVTAPVRARAFWEFGGGAGGGLICSACISTGKAAVCQPHHKIYESFHFYKKRCYSSTGPIHGSLTKCGTELSTQILLDRRYDRQLHLRAFGRLH